MENPWEWRREKIKTGILENARVLRKNSTEAEQKLWTMLRGRKFHNLKFRRQQHIEGFILDFFCNELRLGIEVDGAIHHTKEQEQYDKLRTEYLEEFGISIVRFSNEEVFEDIYVVLKKIKDASLACAKASAGNSTPLPRPARRSLSEGGERGGRQRRPG